MKILILGSLGSMGKRYTAIVKWLGHTPVCYDAAMGKFSVSLYKGIDHAIVATPTDTHYEWCNSLINMGIPTLCEKPVSKNIDEIKALITWAKERNTDVRMVCNWAFTVKKTFEEFFAGTTPMWKPNSNTIRYNNYHTGKDGLYWDAIQLVYLSKSKRHLHLYTESPTLSALFNDQYSIGLDDIASSYIEMIMEWLHPNPKSRLWDLNDALKATNKVISYMKGSKS